MEIVLYYSMCISGVYKIVNKTNNGVYVGSSVNMPKRWKTHLWLLRKNKHRCKHLQNSFNLYGENNFYFEILEQITVNGPLFQNTRNVLTEREQYWLDFYLASGTKVYAGRTKTVHSNLGYKQSEESKLKRSKALKGRGLGTIKTPREARACACGCKQVFTVKVTSKNTYIFGHINKGRSPSALTRQKLSKAHMGHPNYRPGMPSPNKGKPSPYKDKHYKTHCKYGHQRTPENLSKLHCRICQRIRQLKNRDKYNLNRRNRQIALSAV